MSIQALKDNLAHAKKILQGPDILIATRAEVEAALAEYERLDAEFAEAGIALRVAKEQAAHWRYAYERTPTIAAEECNRQKEELEAQLAEAKKHASVLHDALDAADRQYTAMVKELEAEIASLKTLYDATADGLQVALAEYAALAVRVKELEEVKQALDDLFRACQHDIREMCGRFLGNEHMPDAQTSVFRLGNAYESEQQRAEKAEAQLAEAKREREEDICQTSVLKLKLEGQIDDAVGVILQAKTREKAAIERAMTAEAQLAPAEAVFVDTIEHATQSAEEFIRRAEKAEAELKKANARVDIWERDYTNCDSSPLNEYRKRAEKAERELAEANARWKDYTDTAPRRAEWFKSELGEANERVATLEAALEQVRDYFASSEGSLYTEWYDGGPICDLFDLPRDKWDAAIEKLSSPRLDLSPLGICTGLQDLEIYRVVLAALAPETKEAE